MAVATVRNPIASLREKLEESKEERRRVSTEIDALIHEKEAIIEIMDVGSALPDQYANRTKACQHSSSPERAPGTHSLTNPNRANGASSSCTSSLVIHVPRS